MKTIFVNTLNSKTNECNRFIYQFTDKLNLKNRNKNIASANSSIYYTWKNIKSEYNKNKFKIYTPTVVLYGVFWRKWGWAFFKF